MFRDSTTFIMFQVARKYLCIQATSCSSERAFSTGGQTVTAKRYNLDPVNVHMMVYIRENLGKIKMLKYKVGDATEEEEEKKCIEESEMP